MKQILVIEGDIPDLDQSITAAKKLREELPSSFKMEKHSTPRSQ